MNRYHINLCPLEGNRVADPVWDQWRSVFILSAGSGCVSIHLRVSLQIKAVKKLHPNFKQASSKTSLAYEFLIFLSHRKHSNFLMIIVQKHKTTTHIFYTLIIERGLKFRRRILRTYSSIMLDSATLEIKKHDVKSLDIPEATSDIQTGCFTV